MTGLLVTAVYRRASRPAARSTAGDRRAQRRAHQRQPDRFSFCSTWWRALSDGSRKRILLPLAPEYIGYADVGIGDGLFTARRPQIDFLDGRLFKYRVDFAGLELGDDIGAICVSRPTNPTGNVLTEDEMDHLGCLARERGIPLIVDNAYGAPFPGIIYTEAIPRWEPHMIMCMSLSKLGMPGARTGIIIAPEEVTQAVTGMNAVMSLAPGGLGGALALDAVRTRSILRLSAEVIKPHYRRKAEQAVARLREEMEGVDYFIHKPEGAFFLWLWFRGMPISCAELYERLKARGGGGAGALLLPRPGRAVAAPL